MTKPIAVIAKNTSIEPPFLVCKVLVKATNFWNNVNLNLLYAPFLCDTTHCDINRFRRASRVARPSQGGEKMTAVWTSRHEDLVSAGVVSLHVFDHMVLPARGVVLARCNPPRSEEHT